MILNKEQVMKILPHRDPFLFIDSVESLTVPGHDYAAKEVLEVKDMVDAEVVAHFFTRPDHPIFAGHFPDYPILPGVVQIEMMAQAIAFICLKLNDDPFVKKMDVALLGVNEAKFRRPILPGMNLKIVSTCRKIRGPMIQSECMVFSEGQLMSEATVLASLRLN